MYQEILYQVEDPVATITLNRPDRLNAFTQRMDDEIKHAVAQAEADPAAVVIVLTGAGRGFCAGADIQRLQRIGEGERAEEGADLPADPGDATMDASFRGPHSYLLSVRKPIIAAINGPVAGLGFAIAFGIIEQHGGEIEVHSRLDQGTSVRARLPVDPDREDAATW